MDVNVISQKLYTNRKTIKCFLLFLMLIFNVLCFSQVKQLFPELMNLKELKINPISKDDWYSLNYSKDKMYYIDALGRISVKKEVEIHEYSLDLAEGKFYGTNAGEWGGELLFINKLGNKRLMIDKNVLGIFKYNDCIVVLTGLAHMGINEGKIYFLKYDGTTYRINNVFELSGEPEIYSIEKDYIYIVTFDGLDIYKDGKIVTVLRKQFWSSLYPKSILLREGNIYIGARGCVIKIDGVNFSVSAYQ